jgi:hypothetical protein
MKRKKVDGSNVMGMKNKFVVVFAGPVGSSKTPIAVYLSYTFNLPIFSTDAIRAEVSEDLLGYDVKEYEKRRDKRLKKVIGEGNSFILDASIDREWPKYSRWIEEGNYKVFIISMDLDKKFVATLFEAKLYQATMHIDKWMNDHKIFMGTYGDTVNLHITESNFKDRLKLSSEKLNKWIKGR